MKSRGGEVGVPGVLRFPNVGKRDAVDAQFDELAGGGAHAGIANAAREIQRDVHERAG